MLPPSIPTSFIPRPAGSAPHRVSSDLTGLFGVLMYAILGVIILLAAGIFFYERLLIRTENEKHEQLAKAKSNIDSATIESFVRLKDRLDSGEALLNKHLALSNFFSVLENTMPSTIRFSSLDINVNEKGDEATVRAVGAAKNLNALAAASASFADDGRIKDAIFSKITVSPEGGSISFSLAATLVPKLIAFSVEGQSDDSATGTNATTTTSL